MDLEASGEKPLETLRGSLRQKQLIVDDVEQRSLKMVEQERRGIRVRFDSPGVQVTLYNPAGAGISHHVVTRNLSRRGMAFVHGRFVYANVPCEVTLHTLDGAEITLRGRVMRCRHVTGIIHEVGVIFDQSIDLSLFVDLSPQQAQQHVEERSRELSVDGGELQRVAQGRALVVDPSPTDRTVFARWLMTMGFKTDPAASAAQAIEALKNGPLELVLVQTGPGPHQPMKLIERLRATRSNLPIIAMGAEGQTQRQTEASTAGADAYLQQPFESRMLQDLVEQLMRVSGEDADASAAA